jgi:hypothetical protein
MKSASVTSLLALTEPLHNANVVIVLIRWRLKAEVAAGIEDYNRANHV